MRVLVCELVPNEHIASFTNVGQAGNTYVLNFSNACSFEKVFAFVPIQVESMQNFKNAGAIEYFQVRAFKHKSIFKIINRLLESVKLLKQLYKYRKGPVWFYNITQHHFIVYIIAKYLYRSKVYVLLADLYVNDKRFGMNALFIKLIEKSDGVISLSRGAERLEIKNLKISNGIVSPVENIPAITVNKTDYLFAGALAKMKGIDFTLEAFSKMPDKRLLVSGIGPMLGLVKEYEAKYPNIKYLGWLDYDAYLDVLNTISFCLSFRNPDDAENQYNFPSKIIEFFQYGKIVISTFNYPDIPEGLLIHTGYDLESLKNTMQQIQNMSDDELLALSIKVKNFVTDNFSYKAINSLVEITEFDSLIQ